MHILFAKLIRSQTQPLIHSGFVRLVAFISLAGLYLATVCLLLLGAHPMRGVTMIGLSVLVPAAGLLFSRQMILRLVAWAAPPLCLLSLLAAAGQPLVQGAIQPRLDDLWVILLGLTAGTALALAYDTYANARQAQRTAAALHMTGRELEATQTLLHGVRSHLGQQVAERTAELAEVNRQLAAESGARRQSERHWRSLAENSPDLICIWDISSRRWAYWNRTHFLGHPSRAILDFPALLQHIHPDDYHRVKARWLNFAASAQAQGEQLEYRLRHANGQWEWLQARQRVLARDDNGQPAQSLITLTVITDHKHGEAALRLAKENAEAAARAGYEFLANISHEIRTPMNGVLGMASLLQTTELSEEQRLYVDAVRHSGNALLALVDDILGFSKAAPGGLSLEHRPIEPHRCVEEVLDLLAPKAAEKGLELVSIIERSVPAAVLGDAARLRQVLSNVISTVLEWSAQDTVTVSLDAQPVDDREVELHFAVGDTSGAAAHRQPRPGRVGQADAAHMQDDTAGGLARSARLCELMGGRLWADSHPQAGATLHFTIVSPAIAAAGEQEAFAAHPALDRRTALVVDDNPAARQMLQQTMSHWGITVTLAASGAEALALMHTQTRFDIAVIDMQMRGMSGLALAKEVRKLAADLPVIMTSALGTPMYAAGDWRGLQDLPVVLPAALAANERHEAARQLGVRDILLKPVKPSLLRAALLGHLDTAVAAAGGPGKSHTSSTPADAGSDGSQPLRILLAEDNLTNQKVALHMLKRLGYGADVAVNGLEAVDAVRRRHYDIILMDIQMPEMDGLKATHQIRMELAAADQPYIIAMTAAAMQYDAEHCLAAGMDDFVAKPARLEDLAQALQRYLTQATDADDRAGNPALRSHTILC